MNEFVLELLLWIIVAGIGVGLVMYGIGSLIVSIVDKIKEKKK